MNSRTLKGLRQFLTSEQQHDWAEGKTQLVDADERSQSLELRFKYAARFEKLLRRPQAHEVLDLLQIYSENCIPIPRRTERFYWSVSCLPSTSDKPLVREVWSRADVRDFFEKSGEAFKAEWVMELPEGEPIIGWRIAT